MKDHHKDKAHSESKGHKLMGQHPHHKGAGMPYFENDHWQKKLDDIQCCDDKYNKGEFSQGEEYKKSVDSLAKYAKTHRAQH